MYFGQVGMTILVFEIWNTPTNFFTFFFFFCLSFKPSRDRFLETKKIPLQLKIFIQTLKSFVKISYIFFKNNFAFVQPFALNFQKYHREIQRQKSVRLGQGHLL